jgi:hypothetical protein
MLCACASAGGFVAGRYFREEVPSSEYLKKFDAFEVLSGTISGLVFGSLIAVPVLAIGLPIMLVVAAIFGR